MLRINYEQAYYKGGLPAISVLMRGKNDILDPRTSPPTIGYTENSALCIADYLTMPQEIGGFGYSYVTDIAYATEDELESFHMTRTATRVLHRAFAMDRERRKTR